MASESPPRVRSHAPGRVNLIGEHTDYTGGLVLPVAVQRGTTITGQVKPDRVRLDSDRRSDVVTFGLPVDDDVTNVVPAWGRFVAAAAAELQQLDPRDGRVRGVDGTVTSDLTIGGGLSSSSSLTVAAALALGASLEPLDLALLCRRAESRATGVQSGIMDQLVISAAVEDHALLIDCSNNRATRIALPDDIQIVVVDSGQHRSVARSDYAGRMAQCAAAERLVGPLREATLDMVAGIDDDVVRRRARHVVTENQRVLDFVDALARDDRRLAGSILTDGHRSLRDDFEVSTPELDSLVESLLDSPGIHGARLTGAGFGGSVVALADPGTDIAGGFVVRASGGATVDLA